MLNPWGLTEALRVAPLVETETAALVVTDGSVLSKVLPSRHSTVKALRRTRCDRQSRRAAAGSNFAVRAVLGARVN